MSSNSSATRVEVAAIPGANGSTAGLAWGLLGVAAFSFTVPLTRLAVVGLSPLFVGAGRALGAGLLAVAAPSLTRQRRPVGVVWWRLAIVAGGVVVGFPFLTSWALTMTPASHGAVVIGVLPAVTAVVVVLRTGERPPRAFWVLSTLGAVAAGTFAALHGGGLGQLHRADLLLFGAVLAAAIGYAEGGSLARTLGVWQTVSWALVLALPLTAVLTLVSVLLETPSATPVQWASFGYLAVVSMFLGFFAWYRGLGIGPMARVSQVQLVQPILSLGWAALLLGETLTWATLVGGLAVVACAGLAVRVRSGSTGRNRANRRRRTS